MFIPFLGTYDECQRWLEKNSRLKDFNPGKGRIICITYKKPLQEELKGDEGAGIDTNDEGCMPNLTDKDLRRVFSGLIEGVKKRS